MDNDHIGIRPIDELKQLANEAETVQELADLKPIFVRVEAIAKENAGTTEIELEVKHVKTLLVNRGKRLKEAGAIGTISMLQPTGERSATVPQPPIPLPPLPPVSQLRHEMETGPVIPIPNMPSGQGPAFPPPPLPRPTSTLNTPPAIPGSGQRPAAGVFPVPPTSGQHVKPMAGGLNWKRAMAIGAGIGLLGAAGILVTVVNVARNRNSTTVTPIAGKAGINITTVPPGARIQINGEDKCPASPCSLQLAPGDYRITALLEGYDSALAPATLVAGQAPVEVAMPLTSQAQSLRIFSDIPGKVQIDGKPAGEITEGSFIQDRVSAGPHTVFISGSGADAAFAFEVTPGKAPGMTGPTTAHNLLAVLVSGAGAQARMQASAGPLAALLDGKAQPAIATTGTDFPSVPSGDHELTVGEGKDQKKIQVTFLPTPTMTAYLRSDVNAGNLLVTTNPAEDDVTVYVGGRPQVRKTSRGQFRIQLPPGNASVRVAKEGFADVPEQVAVVKKGEDTRIEFKLKSLPRVATLRIKSATGGATVLLDGREVGKVSADGTFQTGGVAPGEHEIEFRMAGFLNKKETRSFKAGEAVELGAIALIQAIGTIQLTLSPPETKITLRHENEAERTVSGPMISSLAPGRYTVIGKASGYKDKSVPVNIVGGQTTQVDLTLLKEAAATVVVQPTRPGGIGDFDPGWTRDGEQYSHAGSPIAFRITPAVGVFRFNVQLLKGGNALGLGKKIRWALGYTDGRNHATFEVEKNKFRRINVSNGKSSKGGEYRWDGALDAFGVQIEVTGNQIVHKVQIGGQWTIVDRVTDAANLSSGKFIFLVNGNEEIGISDFHFTPGR